MDGFVDGFKLVLSFIWDNLIYINMLFAIIVVFFQRKEPKSAWAWLLILYFIFGKSKNIVTFATANVIINISGF